MGKALPASVYTRSGTQEKPNALLHSDALRLFFDTAAIRTRTATVLKASRSSFASQDAWE